MKKLIALRNITCCCLFLAACNNDKDNDVYGQWQVQSVSSPSSYIANMQDQDYSFNVNQSTPDGSVISLSEGSGPSENAAVRYKSNNDMIVQYSDPQTGEPVLVHMKRN